jgi:DNA ligase-1
MAHQWIYKLNESNSRKHKEEVIAQALSAATLGAEDADIFLSCVYRAYNPFMVYNFKRVPVISGLTGKENPFNEFFVLLDRLSMRVVTGNDAEVDVEQVSYLFDTEVWETLLRPVMLKDLRVGATIKTFNKILKGTKYEIPVFECQLASDSTKHQEKLRGKKILEPKFDGIRCLAIFSPRTNKVELFSRNGKALLNFPLIEEHLRSNIAMFVRADEGLDESQDFVLDGEIISENFQALMKQAQRKVNVDTSDAIYSIFDIIHLKDFKKGRWNVAQRIRSLKYLAKMRNRINSRNLNIRIVEGLQVNLDTAEGQNVMHRFATDMVAKGYEGIMVKDVDAPYQCKRSTSWLKWKPNITVDLTIVGVEEGTGRNKGRLGALVCEGVDQGQLIKTNVGSGLTDNDRDTFWQNKDNLLGQVVEIKADVITQNQDGTYSLRFPRFIRFRGMEAGEKI